MALKNKNWLFYPILFLCFITGSSIISFAQPPGFQAFISSAQGNRIQFVFNTINQIENGIISNYTTVLGLTLQDADGFGIGDEYTQLILRVSTDDDAIYSLDGAQSLPLNVLEVSINNIVGFNDPGVTDIFSLPLTLTGSSNQDNLLVSTRPATELINYATHRVEVTLSVGVTNNLQSLPPGYYVLNLDFWLFGCGTWGGVCPP